MTKLYDFLLPFDNTVDCSVEHVVIRDTNGKKVFGDKIFYLMQENEKANIYGEILKKGVSKVNVKGNTLYVDIWAVVH